MRGINKAILVGHVGQDPQTKKTGEFITARFSVATSYFVKNKETGMNDQQTEWHRVVAFGNLANIVATYVKKGTAVYVEGVIKTSKYTDKEGILRYSTEIIANTVQMLGKKEASDQGDEHHAPVSDEMFDDDIPF